MEAPAWLIGRLNGRAEPEPKESTPFNGETSARAKRALERACWGLSQAGPGTRDRTIGLVVYRVGRLAAAGELESGSALQALLAAMAANPGTDKSHRDKVERCFNDGFKYPAEPGPIDDRHATEDDFGVEDHADDHRDGGSSDRHDEDAGERASSGGSGWDPIDLDLFLGGSDLPPPELNDEALPQGWAEIIRAAAAVRSAAGLCRDRRHRRGRWRDRQRLCRRGEARLEGAGGSLGHADRAAERAQNSSHEGRSQRPGRNRP
jgi:hypothetical protein